MDVTKQAPIAKNGKTAAWKGIPMWLKSVWVTLLFTASILVAALIILLFIGVPREQSYVNKDNEQAVLLTSGQVYFGKIKTVNKEYLELQHVFYYSNSDSSVPVNLNTQQGSVAVTKMGCEPHAPADRMVINRDQVVYWENLQPAGQVSKKIAEWMTQNPNGQQCALPATATTSKQ